MNFLTQVIKEPKNANALVALILKNKEELVWDVKLNDSFAWSEHEMVAVRILRVGRDLLERRSK